MNVDAGCTAVKPLQTRPQWRYWRLSVCLLLLTAWTITVVAQQRGSQATPSRGGVSVANDADQSQDGSAAQATLADQVIAILQGDAETLSSAKRAIAQQTSSDPDTISDEAAFRRIRQDSALQGQLAQELSALGYDIREQEASRLLWAGKQLRPPSSGKPSRKMSAPNLN